MGALFVVSRGVVGNMEFTLWYDWRMPQGFVKINLISYSNIGDPYMIAGSPSAGTTTNHYNRGPKHPVPPHCLTTVRMSWNGAVFMHVSMGQTESS